MWYMTAALSALFVCAAVANAGPEWVEDDAGGDAGSNGSGAQVTRGIGTLHGIQGRLEMFDTERGEVPEDTEDLYKIKVLNANAFRASLASFFGGFADFDARIFIFTADGVEVGDSELGLLGNDDTFHDPSNTAGGAGGYDLNPSVGAGPDDGRGSTEAPRGKGGKDPDPKPDPDPEPDPQPQSGDGPTVGNMSTDGTNIQIQDGQTLFIAITYSPNEPFSMGGGGPRGTGGEQLIFDFQDPFEVSGPDGPGGDAPLAGWTRPEPNMSGSDGSSFDLGGDQPTGNYVVMLQGVGFAEPPTGGGVPGPVDRASGTEKGTILYWSKVEVRWNTAGEIIQDTFLTLSNDFPADVAIQLYFINGDPPLAATPNERAHPGWNWVGNEITLTGDEATYWRASDGTPKFVSPWTVLDPHNPVAGELPGRPAMDGSGERVLRGFVIGWPVNVDDEELRWNHLAGEATVLNYASGWAWAYNAMAFQSVNDAIPHGEPTGTPGVLNMDGNEFAPAYDELLMNFQAVNATAYSGGGRLVNSDTDITLHPVSVDLRQETTGPVTTKADYTVWNQNEVKLSGMHRCVTCWDQQLARLYELPNHMFVSTLQTNHGKARIDGVASQNCDLDLFGVGGPGTPPDGVIDVFSQPAPLAGLRATILSFDAGADHDAAGVNMFGMGTQSAVIHVDQVIIPPEQTDGPSPLSPVNPATNDSGRDKQDPNAGNGATVTSWGSMLPSAAPPSKADRDGK